MPEEPLRHPASDLRLLVRAARRAERRLRLRRAVAAGTTQLVIALTAIAGVLTAAKLGLPLAGRGIPETIGRDLIGGALASIPLAALFAALRPVSRFAGSLALDAYHRLDDRLTSALDFAARASESRSPLMQLAIADAERRARELAPRRAVRLGWPRELPAALVLAAGVALLGLLEVRVVRVPPPVTPIEPVALDADDLDLFREAASDLDRRARDPDLKERIDQFNRLVEDLAQRRLERTEAFRRLEDIESKLLEGRPADPKELEREIAQRAQALRTSELVRPAADALAQQNLSEAEKRLRELAERLRKHPGSVDKAALERLRDAMKKAAEGQKERLAELEKKREQMREQEEQLLKRDPRKDAGASDDQEERLLRDQQRELERLERELDDQRKAERQLDRLDRDLEQAAEDIMRQLGASADDLDRGAEDLHRMADDRMTDEEREQLRQRLEDLRQQLREQGGAGGQQRIARIMRFSRVARGQQGEGGQGQGQGQGQDGNDRQPGDHGQGQGNGGQGQQGQGQSGQGSGNGNGSSSDEQTLVLDGKGDTLLLMPGGGRSRSGEGQMPGGGQGEPGGSPEHGGGKGEHGKEWGTGHDPNLTGKGTDPRMQVEDVQASGVDAQRGATRSEVILGAAEKGFRGGPYKRVYTEYRTVAEEQLHKDEIPPGANQHVRRYFDLIRPRQ